MAKIRGPKWVVLGGKFGGQNGLKCVLLAPYKSVLWPGGINLILAPA